MHQFLQLLIAAISEGSRRALTNDDGAIYKVTAFSSSPSPTCQKLMLPKLADDDDVCPHLSHLRAKPGLFVFQTLKKGGFNAVGALLGQ